VYDGRVFIPEKPCNFTIGSKVTLTIESVDKSFPEKKKKLAAFRQLTKVVHETNKTNPLPPEFDVILSKRVQFRELADL
ncbi:MAG: hypothetical protein FWH12_08665, partial [Treponema sp.]|nr:hypothetical protein [Treponema sp.]